MCSKLEQWLHFQILRSMADLLLSNRMIDVGQICTSSALHIISNGNANNQTYITSHL